MSQPPPVTNHPPSWTPPPKENRARTAIIITAILAFVALAAIAATVILPMLQPKLNLRPDTLPPRVVKRHPDGWMDMKFEDLGVIVRLPGKPAAGARTIADKRFNPDFASDFIEYAGTGDACVILVCGTWLSPPAVEAYANPDALRQHADENYGRGAEPVDIKGLPAGAEARHFVQQMAGYPPNNTVQVSLLRRKDLLVEISVNTDRTKEVAIEKIQKALAGFRLEVPPSP